VVRRGPLVSCLGEPMATPKLEAFLLIIAQPSHCCQEAQRSVLASVDPFAITTSKQGQ
jgi:hypothetical protein